MKPKFRHLRSLALASSALLCISYSHAGTLYWDGATPAGAPNGGAGTWNTSTGNWDNTQSADSSTAWINTNLDTAVFGGTAGTVTLGTGISVGGLRFDTTGYTLAAGTNGLSFGATNNTILFNNAIAAAAITGTVGGTGNVIFANVAGTNTAGTLTFSGASATGWSGTTTINAGMTLTTTSTVANTNKVLGSTTGGITLNGGIIQFTRDGNTNLDAINNSAISVNGSGTFSVTSTNGNTSAIENIGAVTVNSGQMNFVQTANNANQLIMASLGRGASTTSAVTFSSAAFGTARFAVTGNGGVATAANEIIAPWATVGTGANAQTDYAIFNASNEVGARGTAASAQSTWSTAHAITSNYTLTNAAGAASQLTATRRINTLRNTAGTAQNITSIASNVLTVTGSTYANGDVVVTGGTVPTGLSKETVYYVVNASGGATFQLAATPGGAAITGLTHVAGSPLTGGIRLSSGSNLETYGILNGSSTYLGIGGATGAGELTTPTGGGSLYLTTGAGGMVINAPITDNGGAVTVVRNGSGGRLYLSGNNTFTGGLVVNGGGSGSALQLSGPQSFTGGITLNGGAIGENSANSTPFTQAATLNGNAITVNGASALLVEGTLGTSSTITINPNAVLRLGPGNSALTVQGVVSGSGVLDVNAHNMNSAYTLSLTNSANTFSGDVTYNASNGANTLSVASIGDAGKVVVGMYANSVVKTFALDSTATSALTFNTRQFELVGPSGGHNLNIANNSAQAFNINTDLLVSGALDTRTLTLRGTGSGLSTFAGDIGNGSLTTLNLTKSEAATWALSGTNSYNGTTTVSAGTLIVSGTGSTNTGAYAVTNATLRGTTANAFGDTTSIGIGGAGVLQLRGDANTTFEKTTGGADYTTNITATGATINVDRNTVAGTNQTFTLGAQTIASTAASVNTTISGANNTSLILGAVTDTAVANGTVQFTNSITGGGSLTLASFAGTRTGTPTLQFSGVGNTTVTGAISQTGTQALTKDGTGTLTLNGTNGYTGPTAVSAGKLLLGSTGSLNASSAVTVSGGTIGGTGTVNGTVALTTAGGIDLRDGAVGTFTLGNTLGSTGALGTNNLFFDFSNGVATADLLSVAGTTSVTNTGGAVININQLGTAAGATNGTYTLIGGTGTLDATNFAKFSLGTTAALGKTYTLVHDSLTENGNLQVTVASATAATPAAFWAGGGNNWSTTTNWRSTVAGGGAVAGAPDYQTNVTFSTTTPVPANLTTNVLDVDFDINSLTFTNASGNVAIGGTKMLTIEAAAVNGNTLGNGINSQKTSGTNTISTRVGLGSSQTWTVATGGTLTVSGAVSDFGLGHSLTKAGGGTLQLSSANTYSGSTSIGAGTVVAGHSSALGSGTITFTGDSTLQTVHSANPTFTQGVVINPGVTAQLNAVNQFHHLIFSGVVSGTGTLAITSNDNGQGNVTLSNTGNTHTGIISIGSSSRAGNLITAGIADGVGAGAIQLGVTANAGNLTFSGTSAPQDFANRVFTLNGTTGGGTITNNGATANIVTMSQNLAITNNGAKTLTLGGNNTGANTFAGSIGNSGAGATSLTKANDGNWTLSNTANAFAGTILFNGTTGSNGTLTYASAGGSNPITFNQTTGTATLSYTGSGQTMSGAITASALTTGTITLDSSGAAAVNYSNTASLGSAGSGNKNLILSGTSTGNNTLAGDWVNNTGGTATLTKNGTGTWVLSGDNAYTGLTTVNAGTLRFANMVALNNNSDTNWTAAKLNVKADATLAVNVDSAGTNGFTDVKLNTLLTNISVAGSATAGLQARANLGFDTSTATGGTFTQGNAIANSTGANGGTIGVTKLGTGTLVFDKINTYTGVTTVSQGTLLVNGSTAAGSTVGVSVGATLGGTGTIGGVVNVSGVLSPGASIETLGTGTLSFANGSTLFHELNSGVAASLGSDLLIVTGDLNLAGTVGLSLSDLALTNVEFIENNVFSLINYTGAWNGGLFTFGGNELANAEEFTFGLNTWRINYNAPTGGLNFAGEHVAGSFVNLTVIPEPSSVALLGTLGAMMLLRRRR
jgi:fibronectin-binding autotransporter adhesin